MAETGAERETRRTPAWTWAGLAAVAVAGLAIRVHGLEVKSLWIDEGASWRIARLPWGEFWKVLWGYEANMAFYYALLAGWLRFGDSEVALRSLSVLFGLLTLPAIFVLGRRLFGTATGLVASALLSVHAMHIWFSQEARGYPIAIFLVVLGTDFFVRLVREPARLGPWIGYGLCTALSVYSHAFAVLAVVCHWLSLGPEDWRRLDLRRLLIAGTAIGTTLLPMAVFMATKNQGQLSWLPTPHGGDILIALASYAGWHILLLAVLAGIARTLTSHWHGRADRWPLRLLAVTVLFPLTAIFVLGLFKPIFFFRYLCVPSMPAAVLLGAYMVVPPEEAGRWRRIAAVVIALVTIGLTAMTSVWFKTANQNWGDDWRTAVEHMLARREAGDAAIFQVRAGRDSYEYYRDRRPSSARPVPAIDVVIPADGELFSQNLVADSEAVRKAVAGRRRVWLVLHHAKPEIDARFQADLREASFRFADKAHFVGDNPDLSITVLLFTKDDPAAASAVTPLVSDRNLRLSSR